MSGAMLGYIKCQCGRSYSVLSGQTVDCECGARWTFAPAISVTNYINAAIQSQPDRSLSA